MVDDMIIEELVAANTDRPRAILTKRERKYYLQGDVVEEKSQAERSLRQNVRERLVHAIADMSIIAHRMEQRDIDRAFHGKLEIGSAEETISGNDVRLSATDMVTFAFRRDDDTAAFERTVERALERAAVVAGYDAQATVDIDMELSEPLDDIEQRLENEGTDAVSFGDLRALHDGGRLSRVEHAELVLEKSEGDERRRAPGWLDDANSTDEE